MKSCPSTLQTIKTPWASLVILYTYVKNTNINIWTLFFSVMFVVLSVRPEWQNRFMQTGEDSFMHTLDWWQLDWQGMNAKKSWGHHTQQHWGASTSKRKARFFFWYRGEDNRTSFNPDSSPQCFCRLPFGLSQADTSTSWQNTHQGISPC